MKSEKIIQKIFWKLIILLFLIFAMSVTFSFFIAPSIGKTAGTAIGSYYGITKGLGEGAKKGEKDGLSAKDTATDISTKMIGSGNLQIMLVDLCLTDFYTQGNDYASLFCLRGEGVYSVDLMQSQASYDVTANQIIIEIPKPVFTAYLDDSTIEVLAEYQRPVLNGSTANGYTGYLNSKEQVVKKAQEEFGTGDMMEEAEKLALKQVESLAKSVCGSTVSVSVHFIESKT